MRKFRIIGAVLAAFMAFAAHAGAADAYVIQKVGGGTTSFTGTGASHVFKIGTALTVTCSTATFSGATNGTATAPFTPAFGSCTAVLAGNRSATVTQSGQWSVTATSGSGTTAGSVHGGTVSIPSGTNTKITFAGLTCQVTVAGAQSFANGVVTPGAPSGSPANIGTSTHYGSGSTGGENLKASVYGVAYTTTGSCPGISASGSNGSYYTGGSATAPNNVQIPGIEVTP